VLAVVLVLALIAGALGGKAGFLTNLDGIVRAPLQKAATVTAQWLESIYGYIYKYDQLKAENDQLRVQLAEAQAQAREGQEALAENERYRELEERILRRVNESGVGPSGLGGDTTALWAAVEAYPTHIAGLPVAVNISCHATRHAEKII